MKSLYFILVFVFIQTIFFNSAYAEVHRNFFKFSEHCRLILDKTSSPGWDYAGCATIKLPLYISDFVAAPFNLSSKGYQLFSPDSGKKKKDPVQEVDREIPEETKFKNKLSLLMVLHDEAVEYRATQQAGPLLTGLLRSIQLRDADLSASADEVSDSVIELYQQVLDQENE